MAIVWLARSLDRRDGRLVVVKLLLPQYAMDVEFQEMFVDEARIASGIDHPNVARIHDASESSDTPYIVMEYIDGESIARLSDSVKKAKATFPVGIALRLVADAAAGLHAAHELRGRDGALLNVVHRDVSPQNILVRNTGSAAVIDFGIAKARDRLAEETRAGNLKGKVRYMAPEQALGKPVDRRVDVWALGAVLFELFAGKGPYEAPSEVASLQRLVKGDPPAELPPHVPEPVRNVVRQALSPNRDQRLATAAALERALQGALRQLGEVVTAETVAEFTAPFMRDRSALRYAAAREAMTLIDGVDEERRSPHAAAYGHTDPRAHGGDRGPIDSGPDPDDDATHVNLRFDAAAHMSEHMSPHDDPHTVALLPGTSPLQPYAPGLPNLGSYSSIPAPSNIASSISEALGARSQPGMMGPTGTVPPPSPPPFAHMQGSPGHTFGHPETPISSGPTYGGFMMQRPDASTPAAPAPPHVDPTAARKLYILVGGLVVVFVLTGALVVAFALDKI